MVKIQYFYIINIIIYIWYLKEIYNNNMETYYTKMHFVYHNNLSHQADK